jgi:type I restriction enzyme, R subunit
MSEYTEVERPFLDQLAPQGWTVIDQGQGMPQDATQPASSTFASGCCRGV